MKKLLFLFLISNITSFAQEFDSIKNNLKSYDTIQSNKKREKLVRDIFDKQVLKNKNINKDTLKMNYGLFVDRKGEIFISYNDINDKVASNTFENIFNKKEYYILPFKDSIRKTNISYSFKGVNRYIIKDSTYIKYIPTNKICFNNSKKIKRFPIYKGCNKKLSNKELQTCMSKKITKLIKRNFNVNLASKLDLSAGIKRIFVRFVINKKGRVVRVKVRAPHPILEREAIRVINLIPRIKPGKQDGVPVNVRYALPIVFRVAN